jgi:hypothetical protein
MTGPLIFVEQRSTGDSRLPLLQISPQPIWQSAKAFNSLDPLRTSINLIEAGAVDRHLIRQSIKQGLNAA